MSTLKKQGLISINTQEIHFSISIQIIRDLIRRQQVLTKKMMDRPRLLQESSAVFITVSDCRRMKSRKTIFWSLRYHWMCGAGQVDQIYSNRSGSLRYSRRLFAFVHIADVLILHEPSDEIVLLNITDPLIINKIRPLIDIEIPQP